MIPEKQFAEIYLNLTYKLKTRTCYCCRSTTRIKSEKEYRLICTWNPCKKTFSWFEGTIFYHVQLDHILVLKILDLWSKKNPALLICNLLLVKLSIYQWF